MKTTATALLMLIAWVLGASPGSARTWTSSDGRTIEAELVSFDGDTGMVTIQRADGNKFTLPAKRFSDADQAFLAKFAEERRAALEAAKARAGKQESHASEGKHSVTYHVVYPSGYDPARKPPLLILFSPGGGGKGILNAFKSAADAVGWVAVGCDGFKNGMDEDLGNSMFKEVLPHIEKTVDHDPDRLYMGGISGGAWRAYHYSAYFDRPWEGIAACGGWLGGSEFTDLDYRKGMAVAIINGDNDKNANEWIDKDSAVLKRRRCKIKTFTFPGGHVIAPPDVLKSALKWIDGMAPKQR